jgi:hypothetical protein
MSKGLDDVDMAILQAEIASAVAAEQERCAKIAEAHKGKAAKTRRDRGQTFKFMSEEAAAEIVAEERGEDIAAEMIAKAIREQVPNV